MQLSKLNLRIVSLSQHEIGEKKSTIFILRRPPETLSENQEKMILLIIGFFFYDSGLCLGKALVFSGVWPTDIWPCLRYIWCFSFFFYIISMFSWCEQIDHQLHELHWWCCIERVTCDTDVTFSKNKKRLPDPRSKL